MNSPNGPRPWSPARLPYYSASPPWWRFGTSFSSPSRRSVEQLESLGANVLVLPKSATLQDYYAADLSNQTLPESHVSTILLGEPLRRRTLVPRLCVPADVAGRPIALTGILPQSEFKAKAAWQSVALFSNQHQGCTKASIASDNLDAGPECAGNRALDCGTE